MNGGRTRARTWDPLIKSQLLYQLSYAPGFACYLCRRGALAKAPLHVQPNRRHVTARETKKPPVETGGFSDGGAGVRENRRPAACFSRLLLLLLAALLTALTAAETAVMATPAVMLAALLEPAAIEAREHRETMLLAVVEALVERPGGVGELLERGAALLPSSSARRLSRSIGSRRAVGAGARGEPLGALLGEIAQRAFHCRPDSSPARR